MSCFHLFLFICMLHLLHKALQLPVNIASRADIVLQNRRKVPISVCSNDASYPTTLQPNNTTKIPKPSGSLSFWSCNAGDSKCINTQDPTATVAILDTGEDSNSYGLSAQYGHNFTIRIMPLGGTGCLTITCKANLEQCLHELKQHGSSGAVVACLPPDCSKPDSQLCCAYSSLFADLHCKRPCSSDDPSCIKYCPAGIDLVVSFLM